jgi:cyanate permease
MLMRLGLYLIGSLTASVLAGVLLMGPEHWQWGLLAWACAGGVACLLYVEQKGHPRVLIVPTALLTTALMLKFIASR